MNISKLLSFKVNFFSLKYLLGSKFEYRKQILKNQLAENIN